jgi:ubiquitin C-terminal hydrolase
MLILITVPLCHLYVASAYASFLSEIWTGEYSILAPRLLKQTVGFFAPQFNNNYQHDSQEFCQYLMDGLHVSMFQHRRF